MALAAGACSHAEPARATAVECRSAAPVRAIAGLSGDEACALVRERTQALLAAGRGVPEGGISIELDLSRPGSAVARIRNYPNISVDAMDRALNRDDLIRLAETVAAAVMAGPQPE